MPRGLGEELGERHDAPAVQGLVRADQACRPVGLVSHGGPRVRVDDPDQPDAGLEVVDDALLASRVFLAGQVDLEGEVRDAAEEALGVVGAAFSRVM